jgi:hypothetical protein
MASTELVTFRGGFTADLAVVRRLLSIEARGAQLVPLADGGFRVVPPSVLTEDDRVFLQAHRAEARRVVQYQADDAHLFSDTTKAQPERLPAPERPQ